MPLSVLLLVMALLVAALCTVVGSHCYQRGCDRCDADLFTAYAERDKAVADYRRACDRWMGAHKKLLNLRQTVANVVVRLSEAAQIDVSEEKSDQGSGGA